jgi:hypothetical protein
MGPATAIFGCINIQTDHEDYGKEEVIEIDEDCANDEMSFTETDQKCNIYVLDVNKYAVELLEIGIEVMGDFRSCCFIMDRAKRLKNERFKFSNVIWKDDHLQYDDIDGIDMDETDLILKGYAWTASYGPNLKVYENREREDIYIVSDAIVPALDTVIHITEEQKSLGIFPKIIAALNYTVSYEHH